MNLPIVSTIEIARDIRDEILDSPITNLEVERAITKIRRGKAPGVDQIPGELIKLGKQFLVPYLTKLFNVLYTTSTFPEDWNKSIIVPIHKSGSKLDPTNYRGISLLSNISKIFSFVLTARLQDWMEENNKHSVEQAGFRREHSTVDHIFTLHAMITKTVHGGGRGKLYVAFIDYMKAFDSVKRPYLWRALNKAGISTKFLKMIKSMYKSVQACVRWGNDTSDFFECCIGTKQGSSESPTLFSLFISSVADYVRANGQHGVQMQTGQNEIFLLIFADDIALISTSPVGLQTQINNLAYASEQIGLNVNITKTKVMVFRRGGFLGKGEKWYLSGNKLDVVNSFKYLGYTFTTRLSETGALDSVAVNAKQKTVRLLKMLWTLRSQTPTLFFKLFDAQIQPQLLYASELWGLQEHTNVEKVHTFACKQLLRVDQKTPNSLVYGETGRFPLRVNSAVRAIKYWLQLQNMTNDRLPKQALNMLSSITVPTEVNWLKNIEDCLCKSGYAFVWYNKGTTNERGFLKNLKVRLKDIYRQQWSDKIDNSARLMWYKTIKQDFQCEKYLSTLEVTKFRIALTRFRLRRNELKVKALVEEETLCPFCENQSEDESHFLLYCYVYTDMREKYIGKYIKYMNEAGLDFNFLINGQGYLKTKHVAMYIYQALKQRRRYLE